MIYKPHIGVILLLCWSAVLGLPPGGMADRYVATNGTDSGNFSTWDTAASNIQWAVNKAANGETVWVSNGTYRLTNQITVTNGIILQSFLGRDVTIINGNYPDFTNRCLFVSNTAAVVDGFTITNGVFYLGGSLSYGVVVYLVTGAVVNCLITGNTSTNRGGGVYCTGGMMTNCEVIGNNAGINYTSGIGGGGGIYFYGGGTFLDGIVADNVGYYGGGVCFNTGGVISNAVIRANYAAAAGGGLYNNGDASGGALLGRCMIISNTGDSAGGIGFNKLSTISGDVTVAWNVARGAAGGGIAVSGNTLQNVSVFSNAAGSSGSGDGGGISLGAASTARFCTVIGNTAGRFGGGVRTSGSGILVENCLIKGNISTNFAGGLQLGNADNIARNCLIINNTTKSSGGGVRIAGNNARLENCTVVSNYIPTVGGAGGGGIYFDSASVTGVCVNTIIYYNGPGAINSNYYFSSSVNNGAFSNCCLAPAPSGGVTTNYSTNNITSAPLFVDYLAGDCRLKVDSPCIDAGTNQNWMIPPGSGTLDMDSRPRIRNGTVDIGCYEYIFPGTIFTVRGR